MATRASRLLVLIAAVGGGAGLIFLGLIFMFGAGGTGWALRGQWETGIGLTIIGIFIAVAGLWWAIRMR